MICPNVTVALGGRWALVFFSPRQVHPFDEIPYCDDSFSGDRAAVDGCHVPLGFGLDVSRWTFPACRDLTE